jgi:hypothetical protein
MRTTKTEAGEVFLRDGSEASGHKFVTCQPRMLGARSSRACEQATTQDRRGFFGSRAGGRDLVPSTRRLSIGFEKARTFNPNGLSNRELEGTL